MRRVGEYIIILLIGLVIGYLLLEPKHTESIVTEIKTDTVYITIRDTISITRKEIQHEVVRDTILVEPIQPVIKSFTASKSFQYGSATVSGEVLGEVLKMDIATDFSVPTVTNTITNTITKKPQGLFLTAGVNKQLSPNLGAVYIRSRVLIGLSTNDVRFGYRVR